MELIREVRTWIRRGNEIYDKEFMLPIASPTTDAYGVRSLTRTVFPRRGGKGKPTAAPKYPWPQTVGAGASNSRTQTTPSNHIYKVTTTYSGPQFTNAPVGSRQ